jgi:uncharacterized protein
MSEALPQFKYHPNPLATGMIKPSPTLCACCKQSRGYVYVGSVYGPHDLDEKLCPWCIANGLAATKLEASFNDCYPLEETNLPAAVIEEIGQRTPGYISWQQELWLTHCNDACEYHGDATPEDVTTASEATKSAWRQEYGLTETDWDAITRNYSAGGDSAFYKFVCRHCATTLLGWDCS